MAPLGLKGHVYNSHFIKWYYTPFGYFTNSEISPTHSQRMNEQTNEMMGYPKTSSQVPKFPSSEVPKFRELPDPKKN